MTGPTDDKAAVLRRVERIPLDIIVTASGARTPGVIVGVLAADLDALERRLAVTMLLVENARLTLVAHAAWHALDDGGESDDVGVMGIMRSDFDALCEALDAAGWPQEFDGEEHEHLVVEARIRLAESADGNASSAEPVDGPT